MKTFITLIMAMMLIASASAQSSITLFFAPSSTEVDEGAILSIFCNFQVDSIIGYANAVPNLDGQSNEDLARQRVESVLAVVEGTDIEYSVTIGRKVTQSKDHRDRKVVIYVSAKEGVTPMAEVEAPTLEADPVSSMSGQDLEEAEDLERFHSSPLATIPVSRVNVYPSKAFDIEGFVLESKVSENLYILDLMDQDVWDEMRAGLEDADNHIDRSMVRNKGMNESKKLRRRMRFMLKMWIKYDAIPSANLGREGAVFGNGNCYRVAANWTPFGVKTKRKVVEEYGREIPWLGWEESAYKEYWSNNTVFGDPVNPLAKKMSYQASKAKVKSRRKAMAKKRRKIWRKKVCYFFRSLTACKKAAKGL